MRMVLFVCVTLFLSQSLYAFKAGVHIAPLMAQAAPKFTLGEPAVLKVTVPTNVGLIQGTLRVESIDFRGPEGWNRFMFRLTLDPASFSSGDELRDRFIVEKMLKPQAGELYFYALERIAPPVEDDSDTLPRAKGWLDPTRKGAYLEIPYRWMKTKAGGTLSFTLQTELKTVGIQGSTHPFVEITGPMTLSMTAKMKRSDQSK